MPILNDDTLQDFLGMTMILQPIQSHQQISPMSLSAICHAFNLRDSDLANAAGLSCFQVDEALRGLPVEHQVVRAIVEGLSRLTGYLWLQRDIQWTIKKLTLAMLFNKHQFTAAQFARAAGLPLSEVQNMIRRKAVPTKIAIQALKVFEAYHYYYTLQDVDIVTESFE